MNKPDIYEPTVLLPKQSITLSPQNSFQGVLIQQTKANEEQPIRPATPINIQRTVVGSQVKVVVQSLIPNPYDSTFAKTSVILQRANGTQVLQASSGDGPITFFADRSSSPVSIGVQSSTIFGTESATEFGAGSSRSISFQ